MKRVLAAFALAALLLLGCDRGPCQSPPWPKTGCPKTEAGR